MKINTKKIVLIFLYLFITIAPLFSQISLTDLVPAQIQNDQVRFRDNPSLAANLIRLFNNGEKVGIISKTDFIEKINDTKNCWYYIKTEKGEKGWVYGSFLKILKPGNENKIKNNEFSFLNKAYKIEKNLRGFGIRIKPDILNSDLKLIKIQDSTISVIFSYKRYIVIDKVINNQLAGFAVYLTVPNLEYHKYLKEQKAIYESQGPAHLLGIYRTFLFIDYGTGVSVRGLEIINLETKESIFKGAWAEPEIEILSNSKLIVYKYFNERVQDKKIFSFQCKLHENIFDLDSNELKSTGKIKIIVTQ